MKNLLTLRDLASEDLLSLIDLADEIKRDPVKYSLMLEGECIVLLFQKTSTRTRVSFENGMYQLGGNAIYLDSKNLQLSRGETYEDTAKIFSGYLDGIIIRTFFQRTVEIIATNAKTPVINGLTDKYHPCQILSDLFTLKEIGLLNKKLKFTYIGDSNNVSNSLMIGFSKLGIGITFCSPKEFMPENEIIEYVQKNCGGKLRLEIDPSKAVYNTDVIYTDVWVSMGDEENESKIEKLKKYQVNQKLLEAAGKNVIIMHCLPAHRDQEITSEILDSENSINIIHTWDF